MFFNKEKSKNGNSYLIKIGALLIHAAKIDENYSIDEDKIIRKTLIKLGADEENLDLIMSKAKASEEQSNQILEFTREIKNMNEKEKIKIIESLWRIIYSNNNADIYETNLMRRLTGLLYIDSKSMGDIKEKIKKENS
ncbi:TerB family tellurite resistance protein [Candidatus Pelagibacter sp.]|nr:TerB family tellurite resistance protein [Candidatus Pelagibacter sp.]